MATIAGCTGFAAATGSSTASVGALTAIALPQMNKYNYDIRLATGCIAAGATLGILIPPSVGLLIYALFAEESLGALFAAGVFPGIILSLSFITAINIWTKVNPSVGPPAHKTSWRQKFLSLKKVWLGIILIVIVLGGIWGGFFTPIEAAGIGALVTFFITLGRRKLSIKSLIHCLEETMQTTVMIFMIMIGSMLFNYFLALTQLPYLLANYASSLALPPVVILIIILCFYLIGGCLMDVLGLMLLTLPIFIPIIKALNINVILFGILTTVMVEMGQITPPIGINVFIISGMAPDIPIKKIFLGIVPFFLCMIGCICLFIIFPEIVLFLPNLIFN
jgi:tripartite ATP-independent transporter DctM subunit